jgi:hypothetical protein
LIIDGKKTLSYTRQKPSTFLELDIDCGAVPAAREYKKRSVLK